MSRSEESPGLDPLIHYVEGIIRSQRKFKKAELVGVMDKWKAISSKLTGDVPKMERIGEPVDVSRFLNLVKNGIKNGKIRYKLEGS